MTVYTKSFTPSNSPTDVDSATALALLSSHQLPLDTNKLKERPRFSIQPHAQSKQREIFRSFTLPEFKLFKAGQQQLVFYARASYTTLGKTYALSFCSY